MALKHLVFLLLVFSQFSYSKNAGEFSNILMNAFLKNHSSSKLSPTNKCNQVLQPRKASKILSRALKKLHKPRRGPLQVGVEKQLARTVLEHTKDLVQAVKILGPKLPGLDVNRMILIAIVHDIAEYIIPDYTPRDNMPGHIKKLMEEAVVGLLKYELNKEAQGFGEFVEKLWLEYDNKLTPEAIWVKRLDKIDAAVHFRKLELSGYKLDNVYDFVRFQLRSLKTDQQLMAIFNDFLKQSHVLTINTHELYFKILDTYSYQQ